MRIARSLACAGLLAALLGAGLAAQQKITGVQRVRAITPAEWTDLHQRALGRFGRGGPQKTGLFFMTCLRSVEACRSWVPITAFLGLDSQIPRRDEELILLRTAYLSNAKKLWKGHAGSARAAGVTDVEMLRTANGPDDKEWSRKDAALMLAVDELHKDRFISDAAWKVLAEWYTPAQLLLVPFTVGHYVATASYRNNVGLPDDEGVIRFDEGANIPLRDALATTTLARPAAPRLKALSAGELSDAQREAANMFGDDLSKRAMVTTCLHNVELCRSWAPFRRYFTTATLLPARDRELLILRTSWRSHDDYSWSAHVASAKRASLTDEEMARVARGGFAGWSDSDALTLRAADEINQNQIISDSTWTGLSRRYKEPQLLETVLTVGNAIMTSMYLNGIGVPLEAGWTGLPRPSAATR